MLQLILFQQGGKAYLTKEDQDSREQGASGSLCSLPVCLVFYLIFFLCVFCFHYFLIGNREQQNLRSLRLQELLILANSILVCNEVSYQDCMLCFLGDVQASSLNAQCSGPCYLFSLNCVPQISLAFCVTLVHKFCFTSNLSTS